MDIQQLFQDRLPRRPRCTDDFKCGTYFGSKTEALRCRHIQPNPPFEIAWLIFDLDYPAASIGWETANLPEPTIIAVNPANAHAHLFYGLQTPVSTSPNAREKPRRYAEAIARAMRAKLKADPGYAGYLAKNPFHPVWRTLWRSNLYDLNYLAEWVALDDKAIRPDPDLSHLKRNSTLFELLRRWAHRQVLAFKRAGRSFEQWQTYVLDQAEAINISAFPHDPLPYSEVKSTAKSVAKWAWAHFTEAAFSAIQAARGRKGGRPRTTARGGEPWQTLGISRPTWYRRRKAGLLSAV